MGKAGKLRKQRQQSAAMAAALGEAPASGAAVDVARAAATVSALCAAEGGATALAESSACRAPLGPLFCPVNFPARVQLRYQFVALRRGRGLGRGVRPAEACRFFLHCIGGAGTRRLGRHTPNNSVAIFMRGC